MKRQLLNVLIYFLLSFILSCFLSFVIVRLYGFGFVETLFWIAIAIVAVGGMSSVTGNATGSQMFDGSPDSQYQSFANIESLIQERKSTNFYTNFKKHGVFNPKVSSLGIILAGIVLILIVYLMG
ncbi:hypothetical protein [Desulfitobacterium metallireducens]|uniref:DUF3899 domain-containing protein n=1 Tax=Desulfitobacterium metallireducens DSM 15288 TaxID=871968 RepID=W0EAE2_9FIRM|nr:hypothetical protein [Desulfitobacterium metallireducens]AHF06036.1 hypothetical protein DESME_02400 [Desulfitobacterium metallireducens DSM 15288]